MELIKKHGWIKQVSLYGVVVCCTLVLLSLCFNEALDYDEAFSFSIIHYNSLFGVPEGLLSSPYNDVIPLWYMALKLWTMIFGESFFVCKTFTILGSVCTMLLGATVVYRNWGYRTAFMFIIPAGLAPSLMHVGINIRTYSWTVFLVTACALVAYDIVRKPNKWQLWVLLYLTTVTGLFCHHFTTFSYLFIYLYLFIELFRNRNHRKNIWKMFACGVGALLPFCAWLYVSNFFKLTEEGKTQVDFAKINIYDLKDYIFGTPINGSLDMGQLLFLLAVAVFLFWRKRFGKNDRSFVVLTLFAFILSYFLSAILASVSHHFIVPRHTMHTLALLWLGIAMILSRINKGVYVAGLVYLIALCSANYTESYQLEYLSAPYMEETKAFIAENMQPGDVVISNVDEKFHTLFDCYMPQPEFMFYPTMTEEDIQSLAGRRVWFLLSRPDFFTEEQQAKYGITYENMGHYGFQIIADCTDFDILRVEVAGARNESVQ